MLKNISKLECKVNERMFSFLCDMDCQTTEVKEALMQFIKFVVELEEKNKVQVQQEAPVQEEGPGASEEGQ